MADEIDDQYRMQIQNYITVTQPQRLGVITDLQDGPVYVVPPYSATAPPTRVYYQQWDEAADGPTLNTERVPMTTYGDLQRSQNPFWQAQIPASPQSEAERAAAHERMMDWFRNYDFTKGKWAEPKVFTEPGMEGF